MRHEVYRSIDKPSTLFGFQGGYVLIFAGLVLVFGVVALVLMSGFGQKLVAGFVFFGGGAASYAFIMFLQERFSGRQLKRFLATRYSKKYIRMPLGGIDLKNYGDIFETDR